MINAEVPAGAALSLRKIEDELERNKPAVLFLCQVDPVLQKADVFPAAPCTL